MEVLSAVHQVADQPGIFGYFCPNCLVHRADRGQAVNIGAHAAGALCKEVCVPRVSPLEHDFDSTEKGGTTPRIRYLSILHFHFYLEMTLNPGDRVYHDSCHNGFSLCEKRIIAFLLENLSTDQDDL